MDVSDENNPTLVKQTNLQGGDSRKFGIEMNRNNRRALTLINQNIVGGHQYPCVVNKRGLSEKNGACHKNPSVQVHEGFITRRRSAEQLASSNHPCLEEEAKKPKISADDSSRLEAIKDQPVLMLLELTEDVSNEKHQMEEVEMEDIFEGSLVDIDSCDAMNPFSVVEYVEDLYVFYKKMESSGCVSPNYMAQQFDINEKMRAILIDWLIEVHHKFELREETLFLTVNIIDRFLDKEVVVRKKLQLVGLVALLLACKYEEVSVPIVDDLVFVSDKAYTRKEILEMERLMLNTLQFNMTVPTAYVFMRRFLKAAKSDKRLELLSFFLIELFLMEYDMLKFSPSFLASAAIHTAQCILYGVGQWNRTCEWHTNYTEDQLLECARLIASFHQKAATGKLTGVHRKYNTSKYGYAAKCEPAHFLVQTKQ